MYIHIYQLNAEFYIIFWKKKKLKYLNMDI